MACHSRFLVAPLSKLGTKKLGQGRTGVGGPHENLAHKKGSNAMVLHELGIGRLQNATLGDQEPVGRKLFKQIETGLKPCLEGAQVAIIHTKKWRGAACKPARKLLLVVNLQQHIHAQGHGLTLEFGKLIV